MSTPVGVRSAADRIRVEANSAGLTTTIDEDEQYEDKLVHLIIRDPRGSSVMRLCVVRDLRLIEDYPLQDCWIFNLDRDVGSGISDLLAHFGKAIKRSHPNSALSEPQFPPWVPWQPISPRRARR